MKVRVLVLGILSLVLSLGGLSLFVQGAERSVLIAEIRGTINPASANYLEMAIHEGEKIGAEALIVELDTPGGLVSSVREMAQTIDGARVPVVVYVTPAGASATSAGALLMLASHIGAMAPGTHMGAAHPVDSQGKDIPGALGEKAVSDTAALAKSLAELRGRNREISEMVVSKSRSLTAPEAVDLQMAEIVALNRSELLEKLNGRTVRLQKDFSKVINTNGAVARQIEMTWGQKLLHLLANPNIATLLMAIGMLCIYVEITTPGVTVAGILGGIMLLVAFISFQMLPIRLGGLLLLFLGIGLWIAEPFVIAHGALAVGGTISFILGILWVMDPSQSGLSVSAAVWVPAVLVMGGGAVMLAILVTKLKKQATATLLAIGGGGLSLGLSGYRGRIESLRPGDGHGDSYKGKVMIRGELWDFCCDQSLKVGDWVEVEKVVGMNVIVKPRLG